jgi:prolipoprotein diacylglyceryltransferase
MFDALAWSSGLALSVALYRWRLRDAVERIAAQVRPGYFAALAVGAVLAAWLSGSLNTLREREPALSHSVAGALIGAIIGVELYKAVRGIKGTTGSIFVGSFSLGIVIGRFGCLFAGLPDRTFGTPTALPWGVDLGDGVSRHPVQIYESATMAGFLVLFLWGLHHGRTWAFRRGFYGMCAWYGAQRFAWEFLKPYPKLLGPFNVFHIVSLGLVTYGCVFAALDWHAGRRATQRVVPVPGADHQPV